MALPGKLMNPRLFDSFIEMLGDTPPQAVMKAIENYCRMLEDDLSCKSLPLTEEVSSILAFNRFLQTIIAGTDPSHTMLPAAHVAALGDIIAWLIEAHVLPMSTMQTFKRTFTASAAL